MNDSPRARGDIGEFLREHRLLEPDAHGVVRLPHLVRGELVAPRPLAGDEALRALGDQDHVEVEGAQVVREDAVSPPPGGPRVFVLPRIEDPRALAVPAGDGLLEQLVALPLEEALAHAERIGEALSGGLLAEALAASARSSGAPEAFVELALGGIAAALHRTAILATLDGELGYGGIPGARFLDGWVRMAASPAVPGVTAALAARAHGAASSPASADRWVRAFPTRQIHVTAGNSPLVPIVSCLRALALKSPAVIKSPRGALAAGAALAVALRIAGPGSPLTRGISLVYWRGGDPRVEDALFHPSLAERMVVWGGADAIAAVSRRAAGIKLVALQPRYGLSLIGSEAIEGALDDTVRRAATDALVWNQRACNASLVQYVEGGREAAARYAAALARHLAAWDQAYPNPLGAATVGALRRARRGALARGTWHLNGDPAAPSSAVVHMPVELDLGAHPMSRLVVVRDVARLEDVLPLLHGGVSVVGLAPEPRRVALRDAIASRGVPAVLPLGEIEGAPPGLPHDGMRPCSELVHWTVS